MDEIISPIIPSSLIPSSLIPSSLIPSTNPYTIFVGILTGIIILLILPKTDTYIILGKLIAIIIVIAASLFDIKYGIIAIAIIGTLWLNIFEPKKEIVYIESEPLSVPLSVALSVPKPEIPLGPHNSFSIDDIIAKDEVVDPGFDFDYINVNAKIPKIIIQTWKSRTIPNQYKNMMISLKQNNPYYKFMFFTDDDIVAFLSENYPAYYETYKRLPIKIQKIDFFRYIAVYHYGGFYMDLDMTGLYPLDEIRTYKAVFPVDEYIVENMCNNPRYEPFVQNGCNFLLGQYAFASEPKNEFIKLLADTIHANIDDYVKKADSSDNYVYQTTGPDFVTEQYIKYKNPGKIHILDNNKRQYFGRYCRHEYLGTWK